VRHPPRDQTLFNPAACLTALRPARLLWLDLLISSRSAGRGDDWRCARIGCRRVHLRHLWRYACWRPDNPVCSVKPLGQRFAGSLVRPCGARILDPALCLWRIGLGQPVRPGHEVDHRKGEKACEREPIAHACLPSRIDFFGSSLGNGGRKRTFQATASRHPDRAKWPPRTARRALRASMERARREDNPAGHGHRAETVFDETFAAARCCWDRKSEPCVFDETRSPFPSPLSA
jgi:hypothetical protein